MWLLDTKPQGCSGQKLPFHPQWADHADRTPWGLRMKAWRGEWVAGESCAVGRDLKAIGRKGEPFSHQSRTRLIQNLPQSTEELISVGGKILYCSPFPSPRRGETLEREERPATNNLVLQQDFTALDWASTPCWEKTFV